MYIYIPLLNKGLYTHKTRIGTVTVINKLRAKKRVFIPARKKKLSFSSPKYPERLWVHHFFHL